MSDMHTGTIPIRPAAANLREHVLRTLQLAVPVMFARMGILLLITVDTAMTGQLGAQELAWYALATAPQVPMMLFGIGMLMGTLVLGAHAVGAGRESETGQIWRVSLLHALAIGIVFAVICGAGEAFLLLTGQETSLASGGGRVLQMFGFGLPAILLHAATSFFLESTGRPMPGLVVMIVANLLNAALNWILIFGNLGAPAMGAEGAALATTIVRWFMFLALAGYVFVALDRVRYGFTGPLHAPAALSKRLRRFGYPMGLAHTVESSAFAAMTLFAGWLGASQVAGFQVAFNIVGMSFMAAIGFSAAASIRVGNAIGRGDAFGVRAAGWVAVVLVGIVLSFIGIALALTPSTFATIYSADPVVLAVAVPCILIAALAIVPDGLQGVLMGCLRGSGDVWPATALYCVAFWGVMVPSGYLLGVVNGGGAPSLTMAVFLGTVVATGLLGIRFHRVSRALVRA
ncbi:MAG: MATE family multidrug resistance protein [Gammaproteobacteria bacterium]|jgi:MATE family multidrug resistance protein